MLGGGFGGGWGVVSFGSSIRSFSCVFVRSPSFSFDYGTQCIDAAWGSLKRFMPKQVKRKGNMKGVSCMNATLERRVYQWLWRKNLRADGDVTGQEFLVHLSKACRWK